MQSQTHAAADVKQITASITAKPPWYQLVACVTTRHLSPAQDFADIVWNYLIVWFGHECDHDSCFALWGQVRTVPVKARRVPLSELKVRAAKVEEVQSIEASMRLDALASAGDGQRSRGRGRSGVGGSSQGEWRWV